MKNKKQMIIFFCGLLIIIGGIFAVKTAFRNAPDQKTADERKEENMSRKEDQKEDHTMEQQGMRKMSNYRNNGIDAIQMGYYSSMKKGGTIEKISYMTKDYTGTMEAYEKSAMIYLPYGYEPSDKEKRYDIFYLMHGGGDDEQWYFGDGEYDSDLKCILDHMIANGDLPPCIVCTPTYQNPYSTSETESVKFFQEEFRNDLIPAVEEQYHTYYDASSVEDSRWHRAFGGFSMGAATTWWIFENCMDLVANYIPVSGDSWCGGTTGEKKVIHLSESVEKQGYTAQDFLLFYGCGDVGDIAYNNVTSQVKAMKSGGIFQYCDNFEDGNFYYEKIERGNHDINTVCAVVYNGLQRLFSERRTAENYYEWAEGILLEEEPENTSKKKADSNYGRLKKYQYYSNTAKRQTNVNVLLPPDYSKEESYPVLYLLHGYYDNEDWMASENVELKRILGNLISAGKAKEMIVVMPYIFCSPEKEECTEMNLENSLCYDNFVNDLLTDLKPFIEEKFSVATGRENTAITGFSMGGRESIYIGIKHPELFGYVGGVCPAPGLTPGSDLGQHPGQLKEEELTFPEGQEPYLFLLSAAQEDPAVGNSPFLLNDILDKNGVKHLWNVIPEGGHDAGSVRVHLYNYLRMIFRYRE